MLIGVSFSEIAIKGDNRGSFERILLDNIKKALRQDFDVKKFGGKMVINLDSNDQEKVKEALMNVFGIDYIIFPELVKPDLQEIGDIVIKNPDLAGKAIRVETKRSDKKFPYTSQQISGIIGKRLVDHGCTVNLDNPQKTIFVDLLQNAALVYYDRIRCFSGLPVGSSGKVLSLLSGGIDSPVASWAMMKRGCSVDYLHVHQFSSNGMLKESKIPKIAKELNRYSNTCKIFSVPYTEFYKATMKIDSKIELVIFRRFLFHLGNVLAKKYGYGALVTGDSIGQVASQTLENIYSADQAAELPVFRPLVSFNKQEIVDLAKKIGTFDLSIEDYKDCCSLVAHKNPSTRVKLDAAIKAEEEIEIKNIIEKSLEQMEIIELKQSE